MATTTEKIRDNFPFLSVEPIVGEPTYYAAKDPTQALTNLANATVADRQTMANLTATINEFTQSLATTNTRLSQHLQLTSQLQAEVQSLKAAKPAKAPIKRDKYCWTHGIKCGHSSNECLKKAPGHQDEATETNKMGGRETKYNWVWGC